MRILNSFSMGESSGLMAAVLKEEFSQHEIITVCANTGQEVQESLTFGQRVDEHFGLNTKIVEAVTYHGQRKSSGHRLVTWATAHSGNEIFEEMIKKYGIPNKSHPHCTRELKTNAIKHYLNSIGWAVGTYKVALGMRFDEPTRIKHGHKQFIYPLFEKKITKADVTSYWEGMPFRLGIKARYGNCKTCWKKSEKKLLLNMQEHPEWFEFNKEMERKYSNIGPEKNPNRTFFRGYKTVSALEKILKAIGPINERLDNSEPETGCAEACFAFAE